MAPEILPICTTREVRGRVYSEGKCWIPLYCMVCGVQHGYRDEPDRPDPGYVGYLCDACAEKWSPLVGTMLVPDEVFAERARQEQLESHGRELTPREMVEVLSDGSSSLSKLLRSR